MLGEWSCRNCLWELIGGFYVARTAGASTVSVSILAAAFGDSSLWAHASPVPVLGVVQ